MLLQAVSLKATLDTGFGGGGGGGGGGAGGAGAGLLLLPPQAVTIKLIATAITVCLSAMSVPVDVILCHWRSYASGGRVQYRSAYINKYQTNQANLREVLTAGQRPACCQAGASGPLASGLFKMSNPASVPA